MEVRGAADGRWLMVEGSSSMGQKKYRVPYNWPESNVDVGHSWQLESPPPVQKGQDFSLASRAKKPRSQGPKLRASPGFAECLWGPRAKSTHANSSHNLAVARNVA